MCTYFRIIKKKIMYPFQVSRIYKDPSIGNPISIAVVKITNTAETFGRKHPDSAGIAASEMLKRFCLWQKHINTPDISAPEHHDTALLLTRFILRSYKSPLSYNDSGQQQNLR